MKLRRIGLAALVAAGSVVVPTPPLSAQTVRVSGHAKVGIHVTPVEGVTAAAADDEVTYELRIRYLGRTGAPTQDAFATVTGWDRNVWAWPAVDPDGTSTVRLPKGRYNLGAVLELAQDPALLVQPLLELTGDTTVTLDSRVARPVALTVPEPSAALGFLDVGYTFFPSYQPSGTGLLLTGYTARIGQVGAPVAPDRLVGSVAAQWARPDGADDFTDSPYLYAVAEAFPGRLPAGFAKHYRSTDLAAVHQRFAASEPGQTAIRDVYPAFAQRIPASALDVPTSLPGARTEYVNTNGVRWTSELWLDQRGRRLYQQPTAYRAVHEYRDEWNGRPIAPVFGQAPETAWQWASRTGDRIDLGLPLHGDSAGHAGSFMSAEGSRTALYRDGVLVGEASGSFTVPPEPADYRLEVTDSRTGLSAAWTFRSGHVDGTQPVRLPLAAIRFVPGRSAEVPVMIEGQPGAAAWKVTHLTIQISYDDGRTWSPAPVREGRDGWIATIQPPPEGGFVSLRATATAASGEMVTETIVRAYT